MNKSIRIVLYSLGCMLAISFLIVSIEKTYNINLQPLFWGLLMLNSIVVTKLLMKEKEKFENQ